MKKIISIVIMCFILITSINITTSATNDEKEIEVYLNGIKIEFDVIPQILDGRTMVPIRAIFETMGATVSWDQQTQTATCIKDDTTVKMTIGSTTMYINNEPVKLDVAPVIVDGRTLAPARYAAESFDAIVQWGPKNRVVTLTTNGIPVYPEFYCVPDMGHFFNVQPKEEAMFSSEYPGLCYYAYDFYDIYQVAQENSDHVNNLDNIMLSYGYYQIEQHKDAYYSPDFSVLYGNPNDATYVMRIIWKALDKNDEEVTIVEIEPTKRIYHNNGQIKVVPSSEVELWVDDSWQTEPFPPDTPVVLYRPNGKTITVMLSEVEEYKKHNCYTEPVQLLYNVDGVFKYVIESEVEKYINDGWSTEQTKPTPTQQTESQNNNSQNSSVLPQKSYLTIYNDYKQRIEVATPKLVSEYKAEANKYLANIDKNNKKDSESIKNALYVIYDSKLSELADITNNGVYEMAELLIKTNYKTQESYDEWATKLLEVYSIEASKLVDCYIDDCVKLN